MIGLLLVLACAQEYDLDVDRDGFGQSIDCDDQNPDIHPGAAEICDGVDNNCDGTLDDDVRTWFLDLDGDGYGAEPVESCDPSEEMVIEDGDCDDTDPLKSPETTWYLDEDGDGWGLEEFSTIGCDPEGDWALWTGDCDDTDPGKNPDAIWYLDADGDGFGGDGVSLDDCDPDLPDFYLDNSDCDDDDPDIHPDAEEICDGVDNNCSGTIDDDEHTLGDSAVCPAESCLEILESRGSATGIYWLGPGSSVVPPFEAWCDMTTQGGGYTFLKLRDSSELSAGAAETECARYGLQLFIPRNKKHRDAGFAVATSHGYGPDANTGYLQILGIYPTYDGARCDFQAMHSDNGGCEWRAGDDGAFFVHDLSSLSEPNGDNRTHHSASYFWDGFGEVLQIKDTSQGGTSSRFMCDAGDRND